MSASVSVCCVFAGSAAAKTQDLDIERPAHGAEQPVYFITLEQIDPEHRTFWRQDFRPRFAIINGLPGITVDAPEGPV